MMQKGLKEITVNVVEGAGKAADAASNPISAIQSVMSTVFEKQTDVFSWLKGGIKDITGKIQETAKNVAKDPIGAVSKLVKKGKTDLFDFFSNAKDKVKGVFQPDKAEKEAKKEKVEKQTVLLETIVEQNKLHLQYMKFLIEEGQIIEMDGAQVGKAISLATNKA